MKIITTRRISQVFFFALFIWFCIVSTVGVRFWQIRGWPVNWFLQLDPLVAIGNVLATHTLYHTLLWSLLTIIITIILGRFFCGWVCPFGALHHFVGYMGNRGKSLSQRIKLNRYRKGQRVKYFILIVFLVIAAFPLSTRTLQTGFLDPIPLFTRSVNLFLLPLADNSINITSVAGRFYEGAWIILVIFISAVLLNLLIPRFFCRFICPLGAFFGIISRFALWRIGKNQNKCFECRSCEGSCEGGCGPGDKIRQNECLLCFNCREDCRHETISYQTEVSEAGEISGLEISRRSFLITIGSGILAVPAIRLGQLTGVNWDSRLIRPPGAVEESEFLKRCIKCGQCMRICPTNVIQPAGLEFGLEALWTPALNNRIGSSGCQYNCTACGQLCPTSAIRSITLDEKHGKGEFAGTGHIRMGTAFFDRGRCLPWAMNKPCIVCQENCPVSPKAIYTDEYFSQVRNGSMTAIDVEGNTVRVSADNLKRDKFSSGDYFIRINKSGRFKIVSNTENNIELEKKIAPGEITKGYIIEILVRLQRPYVDIEKCNGCGVCEHECPVSGKRAVRISAEGETRNRNRALLLKRRIK